MSKCQVLRKLHMIKHMTTLTNWPIAPSPMCPIPQGAPSLSSVLTMIPICPHFPLPACQKRCVQQKRLIGGFRDILMFTSLRNVWVHPHTWTVQISLTFSMTCHFRRTVPGLVLFPFLHFPEDDEQQYSVLEILFQQVGILNNIFVYKNPFKKRKWRMYIFFAVCCGWITHTF